MLVTGGSSGIGLALARELAAGGARTALLARGGEGLARAAAAIEPTPFTIEADVSDADAAARAVDAAAAALGGLDAVFANAAAAVYGPFDEMHPDDYERTVAITLVGTMNTARAALPHLARTRGTLVVTGSVAGRIAVPWLAVYAASKHGVRGFVRSLRVELAARRIPVAIALVSPGPVNTPFWVRARTTDGRLPPEIRGAYDVDDAVKELLRAMRYPQRTERTLGGLMAAWVAVESVAPNTSVKLLGPFARLGWRDRRERPRSNDDALTEPVSDPQAEGGLTSRPALISRIRDFVDPGG